MRSVLYTGQEWNVHVTAVVTRGIDCFSAMILGTSLRLLSAPDPLGCSLDQRRWGGLFLGKTSRRITSDVQSRAPAATFDPTSPYVLCICALERRRRQPPMTVESAFKIRNYTTKSPIVNARAVTSPRTRHDNGIKSRRRYQRVRFKIRLRRPRTLGDR